METNTVSEVKKRKLLYATLFLDAVRTYLSIQASSVAAVQLFGDAGFQENTRRQHAASSTSDEFVYKNLHTQVY